MNQRFSLASEQILSIGIDPKNLDYSELGSDITLESLTQRAADGQAAIAAAGFDVVTCLVDTDPDAAESQVRARLAGGFFGLAMIGGDIRALPENTLLFERIINVLGEQEPHIRFCFNTSPDTTVEALHRWVTP